MAGFVFRFRRSGGAPTIQSLVQGFSTGGTITRGDVVQVAGGSITLGTTAGTNFIGVCLESNHGAGTIGATKYQIVTDEDAVYAVADANARALGATLDLTGLTGAQGVAASSNKEFVVYSDKLASQETLVYFNVGKHLRNTAQ